MGEKVVSLHTARIQMRGVPVESPLAVTVGVVKDREVAEVVTDHDPSMGAEAASGVCCDTQLLSVAEYRYTRRFKGLERVKEWERTALEAKV